MNPNENFSYFLLPYLNHPHLELFFLIGIPIQQENLWTKINGKSYCEWAWFSLVYVDIIYVSFHSASNCEARKFAQKFNKKG